MSDHDDRLHPGLLPSSSTASEWDLWLGKSGKTVKPKLYLALGISGAPEHVEAIGQSEMVIAVNTDPKAPIFDYARYGTTEDLMDVSEELIRSIEELKGG